MGIYTYAYVYVCIHRIYITTIHKYNVMYICVYIHAPLHLHLCMYLSIPCPIFLLAFIVMFIRGR